MEVTTKLVRLPTQLAALVELEADKAGLSSNEFIVNALEATLGLHTGREVAFLRGLTGWLREKYRPDDFPQDVTKRLFDHIRETPALMATYLELTEGESGQIDRHRRQRLNQRLGAMVRRILKADVVGRLGPLDPATAFITSCALLKPRS